MKRLAAPCLLLLSIATCSGDSASRATPQQPAAAPAQDQSYQPVYGSRNKERPEKRGTIRGDFQWAADSPTLTVAASRWDEFLKAHEAPDGEYEDSMHASYVAAAKYELIRVYYLMGRREEGDALLRRVDPVGWMK
jgi:hypothetical protein